jgi:hypothetical protein
MQQKFYINLFFVVVLKVNDENRIHTKMSGIRNTGYNYSIKFNFIVSMQRFLKLAVRAPTVLIIFP